jgi:SnoaL-like domain
MDAMRLAERYIATWNETDPERRDAAIAEVWTADGEYVDPLAAVAGRDEISGLIGSVQEQMPDLVFRLLDGEVDAHHDVLRFRWELVPASGGDSAAVGFDVATTNGDGRLRRVVGFLDKAPVAAA